MIQYRKNKHLELLQYSQTLQQKGIRLCDQSFETYLELNKYSAIMLAQLYWESREYFFESIQKLLDGPIDFSDIITKYDEINEKILVLEDNLTLLDHNQNSEEFAYYIEEIVSVFRCYCDETILSETYIKEITQDILIEMKNHYPLNKN